MDKSGSKDPGVTLNLHFLADCFPFMRSVCVPYLFFILMKAVISLTCDQLFLRFPCLPNKQFGNWITIANISKMERMLAQLCLPVLGKYVSCCHIRWTDSKLYMKNHRWCNNHIISHYFQSQPTGTLRTNLSDGNCFDPRLGSSSGQLHVSCTSEAKWKKHEAGNPAPSQAEFNL